MRINKNTINAIKAIGHDRIVIHQTGVYSCMVTEDTKFGAQGTRMQNAAIVQGGAITMLGDLYLTAPYALIDLKDEQSAE